VTDQRPGEDRLVVPAGTVTLLLADVEGSTRLWETEPDTMTDAVARLDRLVTEAIGRNNGVRPEEQGEGDSFVAAFSRASEAVACALELQRAGTALIRLRLGIHTGEVLLRDRDNYVGSTIARCARLRDLAHGGQTLVSGATHTLVQDRLPAGAWLADLGVHRLRDLARPEPVYQLCHPDLAVAFPALRSLDSYPHNLPVQLTSFVGRESEMATAQRLLGESRLVTFIGSGGAGKTRLALQVAADVLSDHPGGVWQVELAPVTDSALVAFTTARTLGLPDDPGRSTVETIAYHLGAKNAMIVLDNCEHLIAACAELTESLLRSCPSLVILATSREPLGVPGELTWRVPSLSVPAEPAAISAVAGSEAVQLFVDRARRARSEFELTDANAEVVAEICRRLDGIPLAIELAAARIRVFGPQQILAGLHDRFRLLAGGARTAVPRQQTLRASVDWSYDLLSEQERILFHRLGVFTGSFDFDAAVAVGAGDGLESGQVLDQLGLLVDKSLVATSEDDLELRYRLVETVRQYALERLADSGEEGTVRHRYRDHYLQFAELAAERAQSAEHDEWGRRLEAEIDNLRAAFYLSQQWDEKEEALRLAAAMYEVWQERGQVGEGRVWFDTALADVGDVAPAVLIRALTVGAIVEGGALGLGGQARAAEAVSRARELSDKRLLGRALNAAGAAVNYFGDLGEQFYREAIELAKETGDTYYLARPMAGLGLILCACGDPAAARPILEDGLVLARRVGNTWPARGCAGLLGVAMLMQGDLAQARSQLHQVVPEVRAVGDRSVHIQVTAIEGIATAMMGETSTARLLCEESIAVAQDMGVPIFEFFGRGGLGVTALAAGDVAEAKTALTEACRLTGGLPAGISELFPPFLAEAELALGDLDAARGHADESIARSTASKGRYFLAWSLMARARVALADGEPARAEDLAYQALHLRSQTGDKAGIADTLELLASLASAQESYRESARLYGAAHAQREPIGYVRLAIHRDWYQQSVAAVRDAMGQAAFEQSWEEGAALPLQEAIAYAQRGRGERKRPSRGWTALTPAEQDVVRLVTEGLTNKEIATHLLISPRTVQTHLTHIYTKLDLTSRTQLAKEATRHANVSDNGTS
jgi:predicted ATPase/class 3 adenylate cyclase/DNA-binding CsgD family transcriptional regulator